MDHYIKTNQLNDKLINKESNNEKDKNQLNQTLINNIDVLTPASSQTLSNNTSVNGNSANNLNVSINRKTSSPNDLNDVETICHSNSNSSGQSDLSSPTKSFNTTNFNLQSQQNNQQHHNQSTTDQQNCSIQLNSNASSSFASFPFFNAFNLLHPILNNKHLYANNGLNFNNPFTSAYLNQLQNVRQLTNASPTTSLINNTNLINSTAANTTNSILTNPQHVLRKEDINTLSLVSGKFFCSRFNFRIWFLPQKKKSFL